MTLEGNRPKPVRVALETLGCKLNQAETEALADALQQEGYSVAYPGDNADVYILNTCTVTRIADRKARHLLRMAQRRNPGAVIIATGCYALRASEEISGLGGLKVLPEKKGIIPFLRSLPETQINKKSSTYDLCRDATKSRNRTFIGIQNGCDNHCAYCIVPLVRGKAKSHRPGEIINEIREKVRAGYKEAVLTGTEIGEYHYDGFDLRGLIGRVLSETGIQRLRLSSLQPGEITSEFLALWRDARLCPHFHISLQSGSDAVLRRMRRRYNTDSYGQAVPLIRSVMPDAAVTTDVITGFPGETEKEFEESYSFCRAMGFARIHVFPFSPRPGTEASAMPGQVDEKVKRERTEKMLTLAKESTRSFRERFLGRTMAVLWEQQSSGVWSGYTGNYIRVYVKSNEDLADEITGVRLEKLWRDGVAASPSPAPPAY